MHTYWVNCHRSVGRRLRYWSSIWANHVVPTAIRHVPLPLCLTCSHEALLRAVSARMCDTVAQWQGFGFVHGVLNTDNMSLLGITLDYGPYGFMEVGQTGLLHAAIAVDAW